MNDWLFYRDDSPTQGDYKAILRGQKSAVKLEATKAENWKNSSFRDWRLWAAKKQREIDTAFFW